jgi:hypothetical protein
MVNGKILLTRREAAETLSMSLRSFEYQRTAGSHGRPVGVRAGRAHP